MDRCRTDPPELYQVDGVDVRCLLFDGRHNGSHDGSSEDE
jgi:hypothetical protein